MRFLRRVLGGVTASLLAALILWIVSARPSPGAVLDVLLSVRDPRAIPFDALMANLTLPLVLLWAALASVLFLISGPVLALWWRLRRRGHKSVRARS
ncbi:MAG: hypothetical protein ACFB3T_04440 [Geminicoccaceae bacterium]